MRLNRASAPSVILLLLSLPLLVLLAAITALAPAYGSLLVLGLAVLTLGLVIPLQWLLVLTLLMAAVVGGSAEYFLGISQANWLPFVMSALVGTRAVLYDRFSSAFRPQVEAPRTSLGLLWIPISLYLGAFVASSIANGVPVSQLFASIKNYLLMWGVLVAFLYLKPVERTSNWIWWSMVAVAVIQLPTVLIQRFFIASKLSNSSSSLSFDAINGTFGGGLLGGRSGALAMFICVCLGYLLILWRDGRLKSRTLLLLLALTLPTLAIVEVKAVVIWLPLVGFLVFSMKLRKRPLLFVLGMLLSLGLGIGAIYIYRIAYYAHGADQSLVAFFLKLVEYIYDPNRFNSATRELGRFSALVHWWREMGGESFANWLIGFGPGASRGASTVAIGEIAQRYPFYVDISAAAALLWDVGVIGLAALASLLFFGALQARYLSKDDSLSDELRSQLEASGIGLILIFSSIVYVRDVVDGPIIQFMAFFFLGLVSYANCARLPNLGSMQKRTRKSSLT
jgi:hypothetical protein